MIDELLGLLLIVVVVGVPMAMIVYKASVTKRVKYDRRLWRREP